MQKIALLIGISDYTYVPQLETPINDISAIGVVLDKDFGYDVHRLKNPTKNELSSFFSNQKHISEKSQVLIYFAGHGIAESSDKGMKGFLIPKDGKPGMRDTWYPMEDMLSGIEQISARHILLCMDCCFGGVIRWASKYRYISGLSSDEPISAQHFKYFTDRSSCQVITSTAPDQSALDFLSHGKVDHHSPFASLFISGLKGEADTTPDQIITVGELYNYLQQRLPVITGKLNNAQNVSLFPLDRHDNGEYLFFMDGFNPSMLDPISYENPYKGLITYEPTDQKLFFGRKKAISELLKKINEQSLTIVIGASGTGKSSLVKAGIVPKLDGQTSIMSPGRQPYSEIEKIGVFDNLVIDQFEQVITQSEESQVESFWIKIQELIGSNKKVIITVRIDFEKQLEIPKGILPIWESARYIVPPFSAEELREIIITPALRVGRFIEPQRLVDEIIDEVIHYPGSLPLLSFTMQQLFYKCKDNLYRNITAQDYYELGGVTGALQTSANKVFSNLTKEEKISMRGLMLRMVSLSGGETAGKRVLRHECEFSDKNENQRIKKVINLLLKERLIRGGQDQENNQYIEPSHDALVRSWKTMQQWIKEFSEDNILLQARLDNAVIEYNKNGKKRKFLWHNSPNRPQVLQASKNLINIPLTLNKQEQHFINRSRNLFRLIWSSVASIVLLTIVGLSVLTITAQNSQEIANQKQIEAEKNLLSFQKAERNRLNQGIKSFLSDAEIFERADEDTMAIERYNNIKASLYKMDTLSFLITKAGDMETFQPMITIDTIQQRIESFGSQDVKLISLK